jgi:hypothetical protein
MGALDLVETPSITFEEILSDGSTLTNPAADHRRLFLGEDGDLHLRDSAGTVTTPNSSGGGVTATNAPCTADTTIPNTSTYTDVTGCTASLAAGTYIGWVTIQWSTSAGGNVIVCKILAGATDIMIVEPRDETTGGQTVVNFHIPPFVLGGTTTVKLQAAAAVQATIKRRAPDFNGNNIDSTVVTFLKIA